MSGLFGDLPDMRKGDVVAPKSLRALEARGQATIFDYIDAAPEAAPAPEVEPEEWKPQARKTIKIKAYGRDDYEIEVYEDEPGPITITVRGVKATALRAFSGGFCTYTQGPEGSQGWSETGFRSWAGCNVPFDRESIEAVVEAYIARPKAKDGCGGKLSRWWTTNVGQLGFRLGFLLSYDGPDLWAQHGPEKQAELKDSAWGEVHATLKYMADKGFDPNDLEKGHLSNGAKWPKFIRDGDTWIIAKPATQTALEL